MLRGAADTVAELPDSSDVLGRARREQVAFENRRFRMFPLSPWGLAAGPCDEIVGRFCTWHGDSDWIPVPEPASVSDLRDRFVAYLDSVQALLPGDGWILGQRVWYRGEAGRWVEALDATVGCGAESWWCASLRGFALHGLGRYPEAKTAFGEALQSMDPETARRWRDTRWLLFPDARRALERAAEGEGEAAVERLWLLADPLFLVPGNDRETEHYARWTVATLRTNARNPFRISWRRDLEELTVRMGWEIGWERAQGASGQESVVGHHHPEGRDFFPTANAMIDPASAGPEGFLAGRDRPRTLYAPAVAPVLLPMDAQVAVFPRGDQVVVVATHFLPADTGRDVARDSLRPWMAPGEQADQAHRAGLFLVPAAGGQPLSAEVTGQAEGALVLRAPAGAYVLAAESWAPRLRRAGRLRMGVRCDTVPRDVATLSDLLLLAPGVGEADSLEEVALRALPRPEIGVGGSVAVAWEINGLGWVPQTIGYEVSAEKVGAGVLRRAAQALGLMSPRTPLSLSWSEPGPSRPGVVLRQVELALGNAEPGEYAVVLRARVPGRGVLTSRAALTVGGSER
ncbi:MAG: hypothetical protein Q8N53_16380 [Longimicrobiales bacterium]|nr:hypothetical protein [Longimicrobiales bacterium]